MATSVHPRLLLALAGSVVLHIVLLAGRLPTVTAPKPVRLDVTLTVPALVEPDPSVLEKNTISTNEDTKTSGAELPPEKQNPAPILSQAKPSAKQAIKPQRLNAKDEQKALRKVSQHVLYPQAAVEAGMEGTVHLLFKLDGSGNILEVTVAASSAHLILDQAAISAGLKLGRLDSSGKTEIILPITFRLQ